MYLDCLKFHSMLNKQHIMKEQMIEEDQNVDDVFVHVEELIQY